MKYLKLLMVMVMVVSMNGCLMDEFMDPIGIKMDRMNDNVEETNERLKDGIKVIY